MYSPPTHLLWESAISCVFLNPRLPPEKISFLHEHLPTTGRHANHIWIMTSGSTGGKNEYKCAALSKEALLSSAEAVNARLESDRADIWMNALPDFHVGGLSIYARAYLSGAKVFPFCGKWNAVAFHEELAALQATLTALVPAQLYDLVQAGKKAPSSLRAVVIGGDRLDPFLRQRAKELHWPLLPSYGMTEACSQVATALPGKETELKKMAHIEISITNENYIALKGPSLFTDYAHINSGSILIEDPKIDGWFISEDRGACQGDVLQVFGRKTDLVKVGGENVDIIRLEKVLEEAKEMANARQAMIVLAMPDPRLGFRIEGACEGSLLSASRVAIERYNHSVLPFERIRKIHEIPSFPRTALGKIQKSDLLTCLWVIAQMST